MEYKINKKSLVWYLFIQQIHPPCVVTEISTLTTYNFRNEISTVFKISDLLKSDFYQPFFT